MNTTTRNGNNDRIRPLSPEVIRVRERTEETAQRLALIAMRNWEKGLSGVVVIPAAVALTTAAAALFAVTILERTFETIESALSDMGRRVGDDFDAQGEPRRADAQVS
jgi:hypothetical protein